MSYKPEFTLVAGANGSGKSSNIENLQENYLNPDTMGFKKALTELKQCIKNGKTVATETNLTGNSYLEIIKEARSNGFIINLIFVTTEDPQINVNRVANRVQKGGHDIPIDLIHSRYKAGHRFLPQYMDAVDNITIIDNTTEPKLILVIKNKRIEYLAQKIIFPIMQTLGIKRINALRNQLS